MWKSAAQCSPNLYGIDGFAVQRSREAWRGWMQAECGAWLHLRGENQEFVFKVYRIAEV